jgi:hypothetical protein
MELLDRYLYAVGRYLPKQRREDILAELRANILSLVEDREEELGRPLNLVEEEAVLKQHGHPMLVAARYQSQQYLIGPAVFPFYIHVMTVAFPWVALLYLLSHALRFISEPLSVQAIIEIIFGFVPVLFYTAGWITLVFALMEFATSRYMKNGKVLYAWKPRDLPKAEPETERRTHPIFDFFGSVFTLVFLLIVRRHPFLVLGPGVFYANMFRPAPIWSKVYEIAIIFVSVQIGLKAIAILSPKVRGWRVAADLATKAGAIAIIALLLRTSEYVNAAPGADAEKMQNLAQSVNYAMHIGWRVVIVILSLQFLWEIGKLLFPRLQRFPRAVRFHV